MINDRNYFCEPISDWKIIFKRLVINLIGFYVLVKSHNDDKNILNVLAKIFHSNIQMVINEFDEGNISHDDLGDEYMTIFKFHEEFYNYITNELIHAASGGADIGILKEMTHERIEEIYQNVDFLEILKSDSVSRNDSMIRESQIMRSKTITIVNDPENSFTNWNDPFQNDPPNINTKENDINIDDFDEDPFKNDNLYQNENKQNNEDDEDDPFAKDIPNKNNLDNQINSQFTKKPSNYNKLIVPVKDDEDPFANYHSTMTKPNIESVPSISTQNKLKHSNSNPKTPKSQKKNISMTFGKSQNSLKSNKDKYSKEKHNKTKKMIEDEYCIDDLPEYDEKISSSDNSEEEEYEKNRKKLFSNLENSQMKQARFNDVLNFDDYHPESSPVK